MKYDIKDIERSKSSFLWKTAEGEVLTLDEMETRHMFNCMKMLYNHIAHIYGLPTVWFMHQYSDKSYQAINIPESMMRTIAIFIHEIETRGDLPVRYAEPYYHMIRVLAEAYGIKVNRLLYKSMNKKWDLMAVCPMDTL